MTENINQINNNKHEVINATKITTALNIEYDSHEIKTIEPKNYKNKILSQNAFYSNRNSTYSRNNTNTESQLEPQKGIPHCGIPVGPAGIPRERDGSGTKNFKCGTGRDSRIENAFPATPAQIPH
jgi:hypothetical protein